MSFITSLFAPKIKSPKIKQDYSTTKLTGQTLPVVYGRREVKGNIVFQQLSDNKTQFVSAIALCWGVVQMFPETIRINDKRPHYINGVLNAAREQSPGFIKDLWVWTFDGSQTTPISDYLDTTISTKPSATLSPAVTTDNINKVVRYSIRYTEAGAGSATVFSIDTNTNDLVAAMTNLVAAMQADSDYASWPFTVELENEKHYSMVTAEGNSVQLNYKPITITSKTEEQLPSLTFERLNVTSSQSVASAGTWSIVTPASYSLHRTAGLIVNFKNANKTNPSVNTARCIVRRNDMLGQTSRNDGYNSVDIAATLGGERRSTCPISAVLDYITCKDYGPGISVDLIDLPSFKAAMDYCDERLTNPDSSTEFRHRGDFIIGQTDSEKYLDTIEYMLNHCHASFYSSDGKLKMFIARPREVVRNALNQEVVLDRSNFDPKNITTDDLMDAANYIEIKYTDGESQQERKARWIDSYRRSLLGDITDEQKLDGLGSETAALRWASYMGRRALVENLKLTGEADTSFFTLDPGDLVKVTIGSEDSTWFLNKLFYVETIDPCNSQDHHVQLSLRSYGGNQLFDDFGARDYNSQTLVDMTNIRQVPYNTSSKPENPTDFYFMINPQGYSTYAYPVFQLVWAPPSEHENMHKNYKIYRKPDNNPGASWSLQATIAGNLVRWVDPGNIVTAGHGWYYAIVSVTLTGVQADIPALYHIHAFNFNAVP